VIKSDFEVIDREIVCNKDVHLYCVGDLHAGAIEANLKGWEKFKQIILDDPQAYVIFIGDLMNNATKSSVSNCFEEVMRPRDQKIYLKENLKDLADANKILAILPGNHENRSLKDADDSPLYDVAAKLNIEDVYRDNLAIIKLRIGTNPKKRNVYTIIATHGAGGGALTGSSVNRYERFASNWDGVDIFFFGHTHKPFITKPNKMIVENTHDFVKKKNTIIMTVPSWLQYAGYSVRGLMSPTHEYDPDQPMGLVLSAKMDKWKTKVIW